MLAKLAQRIGISALVTHGNRVIAVVDGRAGFPSRISNHRYVFERSPGDAGDCSTDSLVFDGDPDAAKDWLKFLLASIPRTQLVEEEEDYLHFECTSLLFRFVDDLEFWLDRRALTIHFCSTARNGRFDFGAQRRRFMAIRRLFEGDC